MSDRENLENKGADSSDMKSETRRLMEEAMSKISPDGTSESIDTIEEATGKIDDSFQRMQTIIDELLSAIGKAVNSIEPSLKAKRNEVVSSISKKLTAEGLGMFGARAAAPAEPNRKMSRRLNFF